MSVKTPGKDDTLLRLPFDDEVQSLQDTQIRSRAITMECQICFISLDEMSPKGRQLHYDTHLDDSWASFSPPLIEADVASTSRHRYTSSKQNIKQNEKKFWYSAKSGHPPANFTPGLIPIIKGALENSCALGVTRRAALCHDKALHIYRELSDAGWGCGYRNFMMACASLMTQTCQPKYLALLEDPSPGIQSLKQTIEDAWKAGFDPDGAQQLKKLTGVPKWVGTADLWVAFTFRGIPAELVDFDLRGSNQGIGVVLDWIIEYFSSDIEEKSGGKDVQSRSVRLTNRMPLILQHNGHSRTVVGYEIDRHGATNLIIFDPSHRPKREIRRAALENFTGSKSTHKTSNRSITEFFTPVSNRMKHLAKKRQHDNPLQRASTGYGYGNRSSVPESEGEVAVVGEGTGWSQGSIPAERDDNLLTPTEILCHFKVKLKNRNQYQVLYFPLEDPLTDRQKAERREVLSTRIC